MLFPGEFYEIIFGMTGWREGIIHDASGRVIESYSSSGIETRSLETRGRGSDSVTWMGLGTMGCDIVYWPVFMQTQQDKVA